MKDTQKKNRRISGQIVNDILVGIESGHYPPCKRLPSRTSLAKEYHTTLYAVDRARRALKEAGYTYVVYSKGTYVSIRPHVIQNSHPQQHNPTPEQRRHIVGR